MIARAIIAPEDVVVIKTTYPIVALREKVKVGESRNLLTRTEYYDTDRHMTVMTLQQIKENEMEIRTRRMVLIPNKDGEGDPIRMNPESSTGIYITDAVI